MLAPLPPGERPRRHPVAPPEILASAAGAAIAGWESLLLDLSAGEDGLRVVQVLLDADGAPLSASDHVLFRFAAPAGSPIQVRQENVGGRFEPDGRFLGTWWSAQPVRSRPMTSRLSGR